MPIDVARPYSPKRNWLRITGGSILVTTLVIQAVVIGIAWWKFLGSSCGDLSWGARVACLHPVAFKTGVVASSGWCVASIALLLGRYLTPYISFFLPAAVVAGSIWAEFAFLGANGIAFWPLDAITAGKIMIFAEVFGITALMFIGPVAGAWLAGYSARRHRRQSQLHRISADTFD